MDNEKCSPCAPHCVECNKYSCTKCKEKFLLDSRSCICPPETFLSDERTCDRIIKKALVLVDTDSKTVEKLHDNLPFQTIKS
jgi:hypothetical protein